MILPSFANASTVTLVQRTRNGFDGDGNDRFTTESIDVSGVVYWPLSSAETLGAQDLSDSTMAALLPPTIVVDGEPQDLDVNLIDAIVINGVSYEIDGDPNDYSVSPLTGNGAGIQVHLRRLDG